MGSQLFSKRTKKKDNFQLASVAKAAMNLGGIHRPNGWDSNNSGSMNTFKVQAKMRCSCLFGHHLSSDYVRMSSVVSFTLQCAALLPIDIKTSPSRSKCIGENYMYEGEKTGKRKTIPDTVKTGG